jgi:hypothetical protein
MTTKLLDYAALTAHKDQSNWLHPLRNKRGGQNLSTSTRHVSVVRRVRLGLTIGLAVLAPPGMVAGASAASVYGTLTFFGELPPHIETTDTGAVLGEFAEVRMRINGRCESQQVNDFWVNIRSGNLNGGALLELNSLNMKNAHSTLLAALLSGKNVQIDGFPSCSQGAVMELPQGGVAIY